MSLKYAHQAISVPTEMKIQATSPGTVPPYIRAWITFVTLIIGYTNREFSALIRSNQFGFLDPKHIWLVFDFAQILIGFYFAAISAVDQSLPHFLVVFFAVR